MSRFVLAVDQGSQSTKVSVVDDRGDVHAHARAPLRPYDLGPDGEAVHPGDDLWDSLAEAVRRALAAFDGEPRELAGLGLCGIRCCRAYLDARGRLTEPVLSWMDARVARPVGELAPAVATVTSAGGYLAARLTGGRRDSAASYDVTWPDDVPSERRSELVAPGDLLGELTAEAAAETGLPAGLPVFATANDKAVEALGSGLVEPGPMLLSLGTYIAAMTVAPGTMPEHAADPAYWVNAGAVPGSELLESRGIRRGMWTVSWLRDLVSAAVPRGSSPERVAQWLDDEARSVPPGCGGLMTLPDWLAPGDAPYRRGAVLGFDGSHTAAHLHRSVLEGIALTMRENVEAMEDALGLGRAPLVVAGGGSRSDLMCQVVADCFGRPVRRTREPDAAGLGAAICAAVGSGLHAGFAEAVPAMIRSGRDVRPEPAAVERYQQIFAVHRRLHEFTDPLFRHASGSADS